MKISLIGPVYPYRGGIAHHTAMLASALIHKGHAVKTVSFKRQYPGWLYPGKSDKDPSQRPIHTPAEFLLDPFSPWTWVKTAEKIIQLNPNLVITQWWTTFWALPFSFLNTRLSHAGIKTVFLIHNVIPHEQRPWDRWFSKLALTKAKDFIIQTQTESDRLIHLVPDANIHLCHIPPFFELVQQVISPQAARRELKLPENEKIFLFFGFVRPYKGLSFLLDGFKELQKKDQQARLLIAGEFWDDKSSYFKKIEALGLSEHITIIDQYIPNERLPVIFGAADCLVAPYTGGTQSAVASTGLAFGLPMIVTAQIAANISDEYMKNIHVIRSQDIQELADVMTLVDRRNSIELTPAILHDHGWDPMVKIIEHVGLA